MTNDGGAPPITDPDLFLRIAENASLMAEEFREEYYRATLQVSRMMRDSFENGDGDFQIRKVRSKPPCLAPVAFIDGGLSRVELGIAVPLIARAGIFRVKPGEANPELRETFEQYPILLGDLQSGLKSHADYAGIVRMIIELAAMVAALEDEKFSDIRVLMLHGPLQFVSGPMYDHWFLEEDYRLMLGLAEQPDRAGRLLDGYRAWCDDCQVQCGRKTDPPVEKREHVPAVCVMAYLQHHIFKTASARNVLVCGAVERSHGRSISRKSIRALIGEQPEAFARLLASLELSDAPMAERLDAIIDATRYDDAMLLSLVLRRHEYLEWYPVSAHARNRNRAELLPPVQTTFVRPAASRFPIRLEAPASYGVDELTEIVERAVEYSSLLPNYAFPVGLDIVDKYIAVPGWMTRAYKHLVLAQYGRLMSGEYVDMADTQTLRMLVAMKGGGQRGGKPERPVTHD